MTVIHSKIAPSSSVSDVNAGTSAGNAFPLITTQQFNTVFGLKRQSKETKPSIYAAVFISFVIRKCLKGKHPNFSLHSSSPMLSTIDVRAPSCMNQVSKQKFNKSY